MEDQEFVKALAEGKLENETDAEFFERLNQILQKQKEEEENKTKYSLALDNIDPDKLVTDFEVADIKLTKEEIKNFAKRHDAAVEKEIENKKSGIQTATVLIGLGITAAATGGVGLPALVSAAVKIGKEILSIGSSGDIEAPTS